MLSLQSGIATVIEADGAHRLVPAHALAPGDCLLVATGERVAADGVILAGSRRGRSEPDHRRDGARDRVSRASRSMPERSIWPNALKIEVTAADSATLLAEIGRLMLAAEQGKARYRRLADRAAQIYAPAVHGLGLATFLGWLLLGASWQTALTYAIAVLIITCPCALALAVPAVQIAAASRLFRRGIMVKAADGLERLAETDMVVFDKTGTLTLGPPRAARRRSDLGRGAGGRGGSCCGEPASLCASDRRGGQETPRDRGAGRGRRGDVGRGLMRTWPGARSGSARPSGAGSRQRRRQRGVVPTEWAMPRFAFALPMCSEATRRRSPKR